MDVWVTRWANHVISKYHGIGEVEYCNTSVVRPRLPPIRWQTVEVKSRKAPNKF